MSAREWSHGPQPERAEPGSDEGSCSRQTKLCVCLGAVIWLCFQFFIFSAMTQEANAVYIIGAVATVTVLASWLSVYRFLSTQDFDRDSEKTMLRTQG